MKEVNAVIGGEGSGGVIYPALHYGRDALVGIAFTLQYFSDSGKLFQKLKRVFHNILLQRKRLS